ncbi:MAG TPA: elongation factor P [Anaerolineae bacterium]|nr:elongation factor P [Anaerolineae bacterium]HMR65511.1 elongation factor P [Anaerolineae bacterium]
MISANDLRKGTTYTEDGDLFKVLDFSHNKTARGGATIRVKVSNLRTGSIFEKTYNGGERVQDIRLDHSQAQYLYNDGDLYYFMDNETFEQPAINKEILEEIIPYLTENMEVKISSYDGEPIDIEIPVTVDLKVIETEPGFAGDTAQGATKPATLSTGLVVQTPLFVNIGDMIRVDTRTGAYVTRVS